MQTYDGFSHETETLYSMHILCARFLIIYLNITNHGNQTTESARRMDVRLDGVFTNEAALVAELERRLGGQVAYQEITEIDLIHGNMLIDVRLRPGQGVIEPPQPKSHQHAVDGATPAPGSDPAARDELAAGSSLIGRRDDDVRHGL